MTPAVSLSRPWISLCLLLLAVLTLPGNCEAAPKRRNLRRVAYNVYSSYQLPRFDVRLVTPQPQDTEVFSLESIGTAIQQETEGYLKDFMSGSLLGGYYPWQFVRSIDLFVSLRVEDQDSSQLDLHAQLYGTVTVPDPADPSLRPTRDQASEILGKLLDKAFQFGQADIYKERLIKHSDTLLQSVESIEVSTDGHSYGDTVDKSPVSTGESSSSTPWSGGEIALLVTMLVFLLAITVFAIVYVRNDRRRKKQNYVEYNDNDALHQHHSRSRESTNETGRSSISNMIASSLLSGSDPAHNGTNGDLSVVPVAVQQGQGVVVRRYVRTIGETFEFLYGASFLHSDRALVEMRTNRRRKSRRKRSRRSTMNMQHMLSIAEEPTQSGPSPWQVPAGVLSPAPRRARTPESGGVRQWAHQFVRYFDATSTPGHGARNDPTRPRQEAPAVYRDFPRHDGTPCLMYSLNENGDQLAIESPQRDDSNCHDSVDIVDVDSMLVGQSGEVSVVDTSRNLNSAEHVEAFVDRLEGLMAVRHQQYQERVKMDRDREEYGRELQRENGHPSDDASSPEMTRFASKLPKTVAATPSTISAATTLTRLGATQTPTTLEPTVASSIATPAAAYVLTHLGGTAVEMPTPTRATTYPCSMATPAAASALAQLGSSIATIEPSSHQSPPRSIMATPAAARVLSQLGASTRTPIVEAPPVAAMPLSPVAEATQTNAVSPTSPLMTSPMPPMRLMPSLAREITKEGASTPFPEDNDMTVSLPLKPVVSMDEDDTNNAKSAILHL